MNKQQKIKQSFMVCKLTYYTDRERFRIHGDYVYHFYQELKELVPSTDRSYIKEERYWLVALSFFFQVCELIKIHFDKVILIANHNATSFDLRQTQLNSATSQKQIEQANQLWDRAASILDQDEAFKPSQIGFNF